MGGEGERGVTRLLDCMVKFSASQQYNLRQKLNEYPVSTCIQYHMGPRDLCSSLLH